MSLPSESNCQVFRPGWPNWWLGPARVPWLEQLHLSFTLAPRNSHFAPTEHQRAGKLRVPLYTHRDRDRDSGLFGYRRRCTALCLVLICSRGPLPGPTTTAAATAAAATTPATQAATAHCSSPANALCPPPPTAAYHVRSTVARPGGEVLGHHR